jgi:hypothetical protein
MLEAIDLSKNLQQYYGSRCPESYDRARELLPLGPLTVPGNGQAYLERIYLERMHD